MFLSIQCVVMFDIPFNHFNALLWIFFVYRHQMLSHTLYITNSFQEIHSALWLFCASNYLFHNTLPYWAYWQWHSLVLLNLWKFEQFIKWTVIFMSPSNRWRWCIMFGGCPFVYTYVHVTCIYAYKYAYKRASGFSCLLENLGFFFWILKYLEIPGN